MQRLTLVFAFVVASLCGCTDDDDPVLPHTGHSIENAEETIQALADAYRAADYSKFEGLLADDFVFVLDMPNPDTGDTQWDRNTEYRLHQRMFDPEEIPLGDPPLDIGYWLNSVTINLTPESAFTERFDLYTTAIPPGPYDSNRWIARSATYGANVFFQLDGDTDYLVIGRASFTVLEDHTKHVGDPGKFLIVRWEDLGAMQDLAEEPATWAGVKQIFR